jgi:replication-associated recombination protein RarA
MDCLPDALLGRRYFEPQEIGDEAGIKQRLDELEVQKKLKERKDSP